MANLAGYTTNTGQRFTGTFVSEGKVGPIGPQGPKGDKGDKPVVGVDYFTNEDKNEMVNEVIEDATNEYNQNVVEKTNAFNSNATTKTNTYNTNATEKTNTFNSNATEKTNTYNTNATEKLNAYNANHINKMESYNNNAAAEEERIIYNTDLQIDRFNSNYSSKYSAFNSNATSKTNTFNQNATNKVTQFDNNANTKTNDFNDNATSKTTAFNQNVQEKLDEVTQAGEDAVDDIEDAEDTAIEHIRQQGTSYDARLGNLESVTGTGTDTFSTSSTYEVGDVVVKDNKVYRCTAAITTAGAWDSTKWEEINVRQEQDEQNERIKQLQYEVDLVNSNYETNEVTIEGSGTIEDSLNGYSDSTVKGKTSQVTTSISEGDEYDSPSSTHPQPIHNVSGDVEIESSNKNIFTGDYSQFDNIGGIGSTYAYFKLPDDNKQYTLTLIAKNNFTATNSTYLGFTQNGGNSSGTNAPRWVVSNASGSITKGTVLTAISSNGRRFVSLFSKSALTLKNFTDNFDIILEEGESFTSYEPHQGESITFPLSEGQKMYEGDYLADDGIHHVRKKIVLTGTENITWDNTQQTRLRIPLLNGCKALGSCVSNYYSNVRTAELSLVTASNAIAYLWLVDLNSHYGSIDAFKSFLAEKYVSDTPVEAEYELNSEIIDPYTEAQRLVWNEIKKMRTYKNITHIYASSDDLAPDVKIKYLQNPLISMQDDITSMQAQILELAGGE